MLDDYFHGIRNELMPDNGRAIVTQSEYSIYIVDDAPGADVAVFPLDQTVLIFGQGDTAKIAALGDSGGLPKWLDDIFKIADCRIYVHRIEQGADAAETTANVIGGVDAATSRRTGIHAALDVAQRWGEAPGCLIAPGHSATLAVANALASVSGKIAANFICDSGGGTVADALAYRAQFNEMHGLMVHGTVQQTGRDGEQELHPGSATAAGVFAVTGWWESMSGKRVRIEGVAEDIDYTGDGTSRAEMLNENGIATFVRHRKGGWKLMGGRGMSGDQKYAFFKRSRMINTIARTLLDQMEWATDLNMTRRWYEGVCESMKKWYRRETELEHLAGGDCWVNPELNTPEAQEAGKAVFDHDTTDYGEAEGITFRLSINNGYLEDVTIF